MNAYTASSAPVARARILRVALVGLIAVALILGGAAMGILLGSAVGISIQRTAPEHATAGAVDIGFTQDMAVHHAQAVEMASIELSGGSDITVVNLAYDILTTQQNQIGRMQGWLITWNQPLLPTGGYMAWMDEVAMPGMAMDPANDVEPATTMPGMATTDEMAALRAAEGPARDLLFLQLMLRHHQGAIDMLTVASAQAQTQYVRDLASQMNVSQSNEIELIEELLADRGASPLPFR